MARSTEGNGQEEKGGRLIVVSNRLPLTLSRENAEWTSKVSTGGLATAMTPLLERSGGLWIGWSGDTANPHDEKRAAELARWRDEHGAIAVDLPADVVRGFYEGFSNETLWFLFHSFPALFEYSTSNWKDYVRANEKFRDAVVEHARPEDLIWIHDYQLMLLPGMIREAMPEARIGFFLHIPFPSSDVFRLLPRREEIVKGLLGADYVAFHTHAYLQSFRSSLLRVSGIRSAIDHVPLGSRKVKLEAQPISIAPESFREILAEPETVRIMNEYRERYRGQKLMIGVDRIDVTKGLPERLEAYRRFLQRNKRMHGKVVLMQVAVPSRDNIPRYKELQQKVDEMVGYINGHYGTPDWSPIVYIRRNLPHDELAALYALADVALVTPLRDGQNLVAKEYVACQPDGNGVLILSEFAGAAAEMGEALLVNPMDADAVAKTISRALIMRRAEKRERMSALYKRVRRNDVFSWGDRFMQSLVDATRHRAQGGTERTQPLPVPALADAYAAAKRRLLLLDYDGTLVGFTKRAGDAAPPADLLRRLRLLAAEPANTVVVVSGRSRHDLDRWLGRIPRLWLAAEHGAALRTPETRKWTTFDADPAGDWKKDVSEVLEHFADLTPGSYVEEKEYSLVWHYRMAEPEFGEWQANELNSTLDAMLADTQLRPVRGRKIIEVKLIYANKANILARMLGDPPEYDLVLAVGDDSTDEDLFERMTPEMWSVHVGAERSLARYYVADQLAVIDLLGRLESRGTGSEAGVRIAEAAGTRFESKGGERISRPRGASGRGGARRRGRAR